MIGMMKELMHPQYVYKALGIVTLLVDNSPQQKAVVVQVYDVESYSDIILLK